MDKLMYDLLQAVLLTPYLRVLTAQQSLMSEGDGLCDGCSSRQSRCYLITPVNFGLLCVSIPHMRSPKHSGSWAHSCNIFMCCQHFFFISSRSRMVAWLSAWALRDCWQGPLAMKGCLHSLPHSSDVSVESRDRGDGVAGGSVELGRPSRGEASSSPPFLLFPILLFEESLSSEYQFSPNLLSLCI